MSDFMWKAGGVILGVILVLLILKILLKLYCSTDHFKKTFARQLEPFTKVYNAVLGTQKEKLFSQLRDHLQQTGGGEVLEIGSGTGANLEYLPGVSLVALDPNEHMEKIFRVNLEKYPAVTLRKYVVGKAEDLKTFDNGSLAAVLCTITLCSVPEKLIEKVFCEIKRVLKPGGRFYFLEHVAGEPGSLDSYLQTFAMWTGIWQLITDGCCCDRQPWYHLHKAGFRTVSYKKFRAGRLVAGIISPHVVGYAETFD